MAKKIFFLSGLPRSGNTLLSAILNQNNDIYSSPISILTGIFYSQVEYISKDENFLRSPENKDRYESYLKKIAQNYYDDIDEPIIFDRDKGWGTPYNLEVAKRFINPKPKIIFTVRNITDILASIINLDIKGYKDILTTDNYFGASYRQYNDLLCDHVMRPNGEFEQVMLALSSAFLPENKGIFHIVEYENLINNTEKELDKIYNFLEIDRFKHNINNIIKNEIDNDESIGYPKNMHNVVSKITSSKTNAAETLSEYALKKYSNMEFWRENSIMKVRGKDF